MQIVKLRLFGLDKRICGFPISCGIVGETGSVIDRLIEADTGYGLRILACHVFLPVTCLTKHGEKSHACSTDVFCCQIVVLSLGLDEDVQRKR